MDRIPPKLYPALANEIASWRQDNLISAELAEKLTAIYPTGAHKTNTVALLTIIGAVLIGLGTILYIGANWQVMATVWKLLIIVTAIVSSHLTGWYFKFEPGNRPKLGTALLLLGSLFYGAGIWLVAQMFNLDVDLHYGLLLWSAGAAASAMVTRSSQVGILASVILGWWTVYSHNPIFDAHSLAGGDMGITASTLVGLYLAWYLRSRAMTWISLLATSIWIMSNSASQFCGLLFWGFALFGAHLWSRQHWQIGSTSLKYVGTCSAMLAMMVLTIDQANSTVKLTIDALGLLAGAVAMQVVLLTKFPQFRNEATASLLLMLYFLLFRGCPVELGRVVAFNFMAILSILGLGFAGTKNLQSPGIVNSAIVFTVFYIVLRYFDLFFSMMDRSLFFIIGGVVLMTIGTFAEGSRRRLIGSMS